MPTPDLITHYVRTLLSTAESAGWGVDAICRKVGVPLQEALTGNTVFTPEQLAIVVCEVGKWDEALGQIPGSKMHGAWPLMCELVLPSQTLGQALDRGFRFYDQVCEQFKFSLRTTGTDAYIDIDLIEPEADTQHMFQEWWPRMWHRFSGWMIGENIPLTGTSFVHKPVAPIEEYEEVFGCACLFEQPLACLEFKAHWLDFPVLRQQEDLADYISVTRIDLVSLPQDESNLAQRMSYSLRQHFLCNHSFPSIGRVASECFVSSQTLRRRLKNEGTSFTEIKEDIRKKLVSEYLAYGAMPIAEVARMGGFAEPSGLARAVKHWYGVSPREYRQQQQHTGRRANQNR